LRVAAALTTVDGPEGVSVGILAGPAGLAQPEAVCGAFFERLQRGTFPGGCFFAGAALETGTRRAR